MVKRMRKNSILWTLAIISIFILLILNIVMFIRGIEYNEKLNPIESNIFINNSFEKTETGTNCPDAEGGLDNAFLQIKYFYSKFCPWCIKEEPILEKLVKNYGNLIHIEWYNVNDCSELVNRYRVSGVPTFVFSTYDNQTEYLHYGFVYEEDLVKLICDVTGGC